MSRWQGRERIARTSSESSVDGQLWLRRRERGERSRSPVLRRGQRRMRGRQGL